MARAKTVSDQQILEAAGKMFLQRGVGASTLEIAEAAGVSEALLFKRFRSKEQLFAAAMVCAESEPWIERLAAMQGQGDVRANLTELCLLMLESLQRLVPRMMMFWAARRGPPESPESHCLEPQLRAHKALTAFLSREIELGRIRPCSAEGLARTLIGSVVNQALGEAFGVDQRLPLPSPTYVNSLIDILWNGLDPQRRDGEGVR